MRKTGVRPFRAGRPVDVYLGLNPRLSFIAPSGQKSDAPSAPPTCYAGAIRTGSSTPSLRAAGFEEDDDENENDSGHARLLAPSSSQVFHRGIYAAFPECNTKLRQTHLDSAKRAA